MAGTALGNQSLSAMLTDRNMLALLQTHLSREDSQTLRLVCTSARVSHDQLAPRLCVRGEHDLRALRGLLSRGCLPHSVVLSINDGGAELLTRACLRLLRPFTEVSASAPLPTTALAISATCLCPGTAQAVAAAFPQLSSLTLTGVEGSTISEAAEALSLLLCTEGAAAPLMPSLQHLSLAPALGLSSCAAPLLAGLRGASQLRTLEAQSFRADASAVQALSSLTGLSSLTLEHCGGELLPQLLALLTSLTALKLGSTYGVLPALAISGLPGFRELSARNASLDRKALQGLSRLTRLELRSLNAADTPVSAKAAASWQLPPNLAELVLNGQLPEGLFGLQAPVQGPLRYCEVTLYLDRDRHYSYQHSRLLPAGEEALCGAAAALAGLLTPDASHIGVVHRLRQTALRPVGGEAGPGPRNHARWLEALGRAGGSGLSLSGIALSHQDLETIAATCTGLKALDLYRCGPLPAASLPGLARLPRLERVKLDVRAWLGAGGAGSLIEAPEAPGSVLALCSSPSFKGRVRLVAAIGTPPPDLAPLRGLVAKLRQQLEAMGLDGGRLVLVG